MRCLAVLVFIFCSSVAFGKDLNLSSRLILSLPAQFDSTLDTTLSDQPILFIRKIDNKAVVTHQQVIRAFSVSEITQNEKKKTWCKAVGNEFIENIKIAQLRSCLSTTKSSHQIVLVEPVKSPKKNVFRLHYFTTPIANKRILSDLLANLGTVQ